LLGALALLIALPIGVLAEAPANQHFERTWDRTDRPVATGDVDRTWVWGPSAFTTNCMEPYFKLAAGQRTVQYFDKSRMEITDPSENPASDWFVTQGLLATEMITGQMQVGDNEYIDWGPANVHIAGDPGGGSPNYAHFAPLMGSPALDEGTQVVQTIDGEGNVGSNQELSAYGVTAAEYVPQTQHTVASVFWDFMNSQGPIVENGVQTNGPMFANPFYAVGYPITEAYWTNVRVGGEFQDVLVQAFQRRVLTFTPGNSAGWQVEAGNVGRHYYTWRYGSIPSDSSNACPQTMHVTFNVYEPVGDGEWNQVALTTTREVWHPDGVATGTWAAYVDGPGETVLRNSAGILRAEHSYGNFGGVQLLTEMNAQITQVEGPTGGTAQIHAGNFSPGTDGRVQGSQFTGSGTMSWETGSDSDTLGFEVVGTSTSTFHVYLDGDAPPVFFR
jgi:hypothetical protein